jgi:integrase
MTKLSQTPTGVWYIQYRIPGVHNPQKEYFGKGDISKKRAERRIEELRTGYVYTSGLILSRRRLYLPELCQCYVDTMRSDGKTEKWISSIKYMINDHFLPILSHVSVNELSFMDIVKVSERFSTKSPYTKNRYMNALKAIFNFGIKLDLITNNPMKMWRKTKEIPREVYLTVPDLAKIYHHAPQHLQWIIEVEWELGTRPGVSELFSLRWSDVDFDNDIIHVRGTKTLSSNRIIPLTPRFKERLLEMKEKSTTDYLIEYEGKQIISCKTTFLKTVKKSGITYPVWLYDIRHLFATTILANGGDLKAVSKLLGHSSTQMTANVYYHELKGEKEIALSRKPILTIC